MTCRSHDRPVQHSNPNNITQLKSLSPGFWRPTGSLNQTAHKRTMYTMNWNNVAASQASRKLHAIISVDSHIDCDERTS